MKYFLLFLLCFSSVYAGTIDPDIPDSKYIEYGKKYECVLPICGIYNDKLNSPFKASCVIINENYILTAAHVVENSLSQQVIFNGKIYPCLIVAIHAQFDNTKFGTNDIAIARLQRPIKLDFYPELYKDRDEVKKICGISGWGISGNFKTGLIREKFDNKRRAGSNIVAEIDRNLLICKVNDRPSTSLEFLIASGDSGGGLFINKKLAGIHSCVLTTDGNVDSNINDVGGHTRISDYIIWIENTITIIEKIIKEN